MRAGLSSQHVHACGARPCSQLQCASRFQCVLLRTTRTGYAAGPAAHQAATATAVPRGVAVHLPDGASAGNAGQWLAPVMLQQAHVSNMTVAHLDRWLWGLRVRSVSPICKVWRCQSRNQIQQAHHQQYQQLCSDLL